MKSAIVLVLLLAGCAGPALQRADVAVPVSCVRTVPAKPTLPAVPKKGIFAQAKVMKARDQMRADYEAELEAVIEHCK